MPPQTTAAAKEFERFNRELAKAPGTDGGFESNLGSLQRASRVRSRQQAVRALMLGPLPTARPAIQRIRERLRE